MFCFQIYVIFMSWLHFIKTFIIDHHQTFFFIPFCCCCLSVRQLVHLVLFSRINFSSYTWVYTLCVVCILERITRCVGWVGWDRPRYGWCYRLSAADRDRTPGPRRHLRWCSVYRDLPQENTGTIYISMINNSVINDFIHVFGFLSKSNFYRKYAYTAHILVIYIVFVRVAGRSEMPLYSKF